MVWTGVLLRFPVIIDCCRYFGCIHGDRKSGMQLRAFSQKAEWAIRWTFYISHTGKCSIPYVSGPCGYGWSLQGFVTSPNKRMHCGNPQIGHGIVWSCQILNGKGRGRRGMRKIVLKWGNRPHLRSSPHPAGNLCKGFTSVEQEIFFAAYPSSVFPFR